MLNRFFTLAAQNDKAYVELLFWKNVGAVREMTEGYSKDGWGLYFFCLYLADYCCKLKMHSKIFLFVYTLNLKNISIREGKAPAWTEEEEEELRRLYMEHRDSEGLLLNIMSAHLFLYCLCYK